MYAVILHANALQIHTSSLGEGVLILCLLYRAMILSELLHAFCSKNCIFLLLLYAQTSSFSSEKHVRHFIITCISSLHQLFAITMCNTSVWWRVDRSHIYTLLLSNYHTSQTESNDNNDSNYCCYHYCCCFTV